MTWCLFLARLLILGSFIMPPGCIGSDALTPGVVEGHLKIFSPKPTQLAEGEVSKNADAAYGKYPLVVFTKDQHKEVARVVPDENGDYRVALPPGEYLLDVQGRAPKLIRAIPKAFTVVPNQTVRVDIEIDTGIR
jgi:hypothetical protein